ncbi:MAG: exo-alpha-sialidase [Thermoguttaceae bacterium]|nr:exo-alpha-sialidase [Thermoguttaceae bacterium]
MKITKWLLASLCLAAALCAGRCAADDPLVPPPILRPVPEKYADSQRRWQGIPSLEATSDSRIWICWYSGGRTEDEENYILLVTSPDRGETWSKPIFAIDPPGMVRAFDASMWLDPNGRFWLFWSQGEQDYSGEKREWDGRVGVWAITTDNPEAGEDAVWSEPRRICDGIMMCKPIVDSRGRYLLPVSIWRISGKYQHLVPPERIGASLWCSEDQGKTFSFLGRSWADKEVSEYDEHNIVEMKDGSLKMFARTKYGIGESVSNDGGVTWPDLAPSPIKHTSSRFFVRRLNSGRLILVKNGPIDSDVGRTRMMAFLSDDDGATWSDGLVIDERTNVSYPDGNQTEDGTIFLTYDHDRYGQREIMAARITEEDILAGKIVTEGSKLKIRVNQATGERSW